MTGIEYKARRLGKHGFKIMLSPTVGGPIAEKKTDVYDVCVYEYGPGNGWFEKGVTHLISISDINGENGTSYRLCPGSNDLDLRIYNGESIQIEGFVKSSSQEDFKEMKRKLNLGIEIIGHLGTPHKRKK